jgi:RNA polymerase sigma factor (sigma-70 family)
MSDHDLLQRYARTGDQAAFTELVARHLNLVYSAARRQVRPPQLAEEVAQSVFLDLARRARDFPSGQPLAPWLHVVTRRTAVDTLRRESRRQAREQTASEIAAMQTPDSTWSHIAPLLDEAVATLPDADRTSLVLRFFEQKSLREIGTALGTNEDAAQKRVSRALDQLRTLLTRRGLTVTAAGLATNLSAHAILTAPATLSATISASVIATLPAAALAGAHAFAMTTLQKSLAATVIALGLGAGVYQATIYARQTSDLAALARRETDLAAQLRATRNQHAALTARLKSVEAQIDVRLAAATSRTPDDAALAAQIATWFANLDQLKQTLIQRPELNLPELTLLSAEAWFDTATRADLRAEAGVRRALADLRNQAIGQAGAKLGGALSAFITTHGGALPSDISDLAPHLPPPLDASWLGRYTLLNTTLVSDLPATVRPNEFIIVKSPLDPEHDKSFLIGIYTTVAFDPPVDPPARDRRTTLWPHPNLPLNAPTHSSDPEVGVALRRYYRSNAPALPALPVR